MSGWNPDVYRTFSPSESHWSLCREFIDRHRNHFPEEQVVAMAYIFANSQLLMREGEADQMRRLVWDQLPVGTDGTLPGEMEKCCWEREAEPEFPQLSSDVEVIEESVEIVVISEEDTPMEEAPNCSSKINRPFKSMIIPEIAKLTYFKPVEAIQKTKEIYRSLVILDNDFEKTLQEFDKLGLGSLLVLAKMNDVGNCRGVVSVKTSERLFELVEALGTTLKKAKQKARKAFLKEMKHVCYQIVSKKPFHNTSNLIASQDPATKMAHYKSIMENYSKQPIKQSLTFSKELSQVERDELKRIALELNLTTCTVGPRNQRRLKIMGPTIPALAVVERIVVQKDPELCELYEVIPPSVGAIQQC